MALRPRNTFCCSASPLRLNVEIFSLECLNCFDHMDISIFPMRFWRKFYCMVINISQITSTEIYSSWPYNTSTQLVDSINSTIELVNRHLTTESIFVKSLVVESRPFFFFCTPVSHLMLGLRIVNDYPSWLYKYLQNQHQNSSSNITYVGLTSSVKPAQVLISKKAFDFKYLDLVLCI